MRRKRPFMPLSVHGGCRSVGLYSHGVPVGLDRNYGRAPAA